MPAVVKKQEPAPKRAPRISTTMRIRSDIIDKLDAEARARCMSRTALVEQITAKFLKSKGYGLKTIKVTV